MPTSPQGRGQSWESEPEGDGERGDGAPQGPRRVKETQLAPSPVGSPQSGPRDQSAPGRRKEWLGLWLLFLSCRVSTAPPVLPGVALPLGEASRETRASQGPLL